MQKISVSLGNGIELACLERPGGEVPLVLLHGITENALTWAPVLDGIDPRCRVVALDLRGHGGSARPDALYDAEAYADDVRHFIDEIAGAPTLLAGHSLGGVVAVQVGATAPGRVRALFLEDPPLYFVNNLNETYRGLFEGMVMIAKTLQDGTRSADDWFEVMANAPDPYTGRPGIETMGETRIRLRLDSIRSMKPKALEDALEGSLHWDTDGVLARLECPVTLVIGDPELGGVMTPEEAGHLMRIVDGAHAIQVDRVGHLVHDQRPDEWLTAVNGWIDEVLAAG